MTTATHSRTSRMLGRARQIWTELDYAQRRLFEIRTGDTSLRREEAPRISKRIDGLESLLSYVECE